MIDKHQVTQLAQKATAGDQNALNDLISIHYQKFYNLAYQTVKDPDVAADVTQDSCMEILSTISNLQNPAAFATWSQRIVYHQCMRHFRGNREVQFEENEDGETILDTLPDEREGVLPEEVTENKEFKQILQNMLDSLPAEQRSAMLLYYYEKLSVKQIADVQQTSEGTVKSRLNYGRKAIKTQVEDYEKKSGIRLHSIAPLPILLLWLFKAGAEESAAISASTAAAVGASGVTAAATGASAAGTAAATGAAASTGTVFSAKVVAGALAATLAVGGIVGGTVALWPDSPPETTHSTTAAPPPHVHRFDFGYGYGEDSHFLLCACGEAAAKESHSFDLYTCTVCGCGNLEGPFWFAEKDGICYISGSYFTPFGDWVIPTEDEGRPVTAIAAEAFSMDYHVTSVCIPETITSIGAGAFLECSGLHTVYIPGTVGAIQDRTFQDCTALTNLTMGIGLTGIGESAFRGCISLKQVAIPTGVTYLGGQAFADCTGLERVYLPSELETLGKDAFSHCTALKEIYFLGTMAQWKALLAQQSVDYWAAESGEFTVYCLDGALQKNQL